MRRWLSVLFLSPLWLLGLLALAIAVAGAAGFRYNGSDSMPHGWYWGCGPGETARKGALVTCLPVPRANVVPNPAFDVAVKRGYVRPGEPLLKKVVALEGDRISIGPAGVSVNGVPLPNSRPLGRDGAGRPLPQVAMSDYPLQAGEVLLMSDYSPVSFDGRYFGPIPRACLKSVLRPILTW